MAVVATSVPVVLECIVGYLVREKAPTGEPRGPVNFTASPPRIGRPLMPDPAGISLTAVTVSNLSRHRGQHALFRPPPPDNPRDRRRGGTVRRPVELLVGEGTVPDNVLD